MSVALSLPPSCHYFCRGAGEPLLGAKGLHAVDSSLFLAAITVNSFLQKSNDNRTRFIPPTVDVHKGGSFSLTHLLSASYGFMR